MKRQRPNRMKCSTIFRHICEHLDADLRSPRCREIKAHIDGCKNCTVYLASLKKTISLYRCYPVPAIPRRARKKMFAALTLQTTTSPR